MTALWPGKALSEVCEIKPPKSEAKRRLKDSDLVSFVPMEDLGINQKFLEPKAERKLGQVAGSYTYFADGDVLLAKITPCFENGKLGIASGLTNGIGFGSSEYIVFRPGDELSGEYLYYFLSQDSFRADGIRTMSGAVGHKRVSKEFVESCQIPLPSLPEQQHVVAILDEAFAGLATAAANAEKNLKNARDLREAAVNLAVAGFLTENWRADCSTVENSASKLEAELARRRANWGGPAPYKEPASPVSAKEVSLPNGWTLASPEQVCSHIVDCPHTTPKWTSAGQLCLRTTNFRPGQLDLEVRHFVSDATYVERIDRLEPRQGDIVYSREGGILGIACTIPEGLKVCLGQRMMLFRLNADLIVPEFFMWVLNSGLILSEVRRLVGGAASPHLNIRDIRRFPIPLPPLAEQKKIVATLALFLDEARSLENHYKRRIAALISLKHALLQKAFSGELTSPPSQAVKEAAE